MGHTGLELFMEKLKQMIYSNDNQLLSNHPSILSERPQFKLLYEELESTIQTFQFIDEHHELQQVTDLKKRFKDAAEEAHDIVDLFVYTINISKQIPLNQVSVPPASQPKRNKEGWFSARCMPVRLTKLVKKEKVTLKDVMISLKSIKMDFIAIHDKLKMDSSPRSDPMKTPSTAAAETSSPKSDLRTKKVHEDIVVGFDRHVELIRDKLTEDQKQLDVVSIVGMGGVGKTTLATKVFNDRFIMYHFHVRGWVTVSQTYEKQDLLIRILESIANKIDNVRDHSYPQLRQMLHQKLMGKRYLIVIDDIWSTTAWDDVKLSFPNNHTGSLILLTSRLKEVALHAKSHGLIHQLECLTKEESWELLCTKVFNSSDCPKWLIEPGMKIASNCHGLPLTLVVVAGVLAKEAANQDSWERIGRGVSSYIISGQTEYIELLALSVDHLPGHLRDCFLYLGGFPEDYKFLVQRLIWLWMAEGFIQEDGKKRLEEVGEDYLMELADRNLVVVADRTSSGGIKTFYIHDLLRELSLKIATNENFCLKAQQTMHMVEAFKHRRVFIEHNIIIRNAPRIRSLLCVYRLHDMRKLISKCSDFWMLLMVLDLRYGELGYFPEEISLLVHLRYLAISYNGDRKSPSSICKLWSLQTLIIRTNHFHYFLELPESISNLVNLRHLMCEGYSYIMFPVIQKPMNLQTISRVMLGDGAESWGKCFPSIKKLSCYTRRQMECDLESLIFLEHLKLSRYWNVRRELKLIGFPASLKTLVLELCDLPWSDMLIIQSLPNLEVLKLLAYSFVGPQWDSGEEQFRQIKVLKLFDLKIKKWEACSINFPCLKQLAVEWCDELEEIPSDFGYIPTLELVSIYNCKDSLVESLVAIQENQHAQGNFELKISIKRDMEF